jgi:hypothetical protein
MGKIIQALVAIIRKPLAYLWRGREAEIIIPPIAPCETLDAGVGFAELRRWSAEELKNRQNSQD